MRDAHADHVSGARGSAGVVVLGQPLGQGDVNEPVVGGAPGDTCGDRVPAPLTLGDEHLHDASLLALVLLSGDAAHKRVKPPVALLDDLGGDLVVAIGGRRARARGVLEGVGRGEAGALDDVEGGLEVLLGLAGGSRR